MPAEDFDNGQSGQNTTEFNDAAHQQGQTQGAVPGADPLDVDNDTGTEAITGTDPKGALADETVDNLPAENDDDIEEIDFDPTTETVDQDSDRDLDDDDLTDAVEDKDGDGI